MSLKQSLIAGIVAGFALLPANAGSLDARNVDAWVAHADAVFAAADVQNWVAHADLVFADADTRNWVAHADRVFAEADIQNWVAHADAVFDAADRENLALANALEGNVDRVARIDR